MFVSDALFVGDDQEPRIIMVKVKSTCPRCGRIGKRVSVVWHQAHRKVYKHCVYCLRIMERSGESFE